MIEDTLKVFDNSKNKQSSTQFLFYKDHKAENRPKIKSSVRITPDSRSQDL